MAEVSTYTQVKPTTLRHWFWDRSDGLGMGPVFQSDYEPIGNDYAVSFLNLIEVKVAAHFKSKGVKPSLIRRAHQLLQAEFGTSHPFAHENLRTDGKRIIRNSDDKELRDVVSRQLFFGHVWSRLHQFRYSRISHLAEAWKIARGVWINPRVGFGKPVVENSGVSTLIVANQFLANGRDAPLVARLYRVTESGVQDAFRFERRLGRLN